MSDGEVYLTEWDTDLERMHVALSEVGLEPTDGGGGWWGWDRDLSQAEYDLVVKAEKLAGKWPADVLAHIQLSEAARG